MPLDLGRVAAQLDALASDVLEHTADRDSRLDRAVEMLAFADGEVVNGKRARGRVTWLVPNNPPDLAVHQLASIPPASYRALAVDGSHIDVDRHSPVQCALVNISKVALEYGTQPQARLESHPRLYAGPEDLAIMDPVGVRSQSLEGLLLGIKRSVDEVIALADLAEESADELPTVALIDGSLILWGLAGQGYPEYVRQALLTAGLVPAMDRLRAVSKHYPLVLAAYISLPRSREVINALRLLACPYEPVECDRHCGQLRSGQRPCDQVGGLLDRDLFARTLAGGERSAVFTSYSSIVRDYYGDHGTAFCYINTGEEMARVEVPAWVAEDDDLLSLTHSLILDQCRKGLGYPVAIMEAHEQAIIRGAERELFRQMVDETLVEHRLPVYTSEKSRSKRVRWL